MKTGKRTLKAMALGLALLIGAPALAAPDKDDEKPAAAEGAETAYGLVGNAFTDGFNLMRQGADKAVEETREVGRQINKGAKKVGEKTVEGARKTYDAVTDEKVQAGVTGGLAVGVPAGGAAYLIAFAAGAANPVIAAAATTAVVGGVVGARTADAYEKSHPEE